MKFQVVCPNCTVDCSMNRQVDLFPTNRDCCSKCMGMIADRASIVMQFRDCYENMRAFTHGNHRSDILRSFLSHYKCIVCNKIICQACWINVWKIIAKSPYPGSIYRVYPGLFRTPTTEHGAFNTPTTEHGASETPTTEYGAVTPATSHGNFGTPARNGYQVQVPREVTEMRVPSLTCTGCNNFNLVLHLSISDKCSHCRAGQGSMFKCSGSIVRCCSFALCFECWIDAFNAENESWIQFMRNEFK